MELFPRLRELPETARLAVGGAIRDLLLGRTPNDVDVECDDPLAVAQSLGRKVIQLGRDDLIAWRVVEGDRIYDFSELSPLGRRDFTINAIAVELASGELRDPFAGAADAVARVVRMIDAKNFDDDPLRLLRAVRFGVTLGFEIDAATVDAVRARAAKINSVARERIEYELLVIFSAGAFRRALALLHATALDVPLFSFELDASRFHADDLALAAAYAAMDRLKPVSQSAHAGGPPWDRLQPVHLRRDIAMLQHLVDHHDRIALYDAGERVVSQLPALLRALGRDDRLDLPDFSICALLDGDAIAALTALPPGPRLGEIKRALLEAQIRGEVRTAEEAVTFVRRIVSRA
jgi:tRNA nucleotidyltransferase/poly(A) polymerase